MMPGMSDPDLATALSSLQALAASREPVSYTGALPVFCALVGVLFGPSTQTARVLCHLADAMCVATDQAAGLAYLCNSVAHAFLVTEQGQPLNELAALLRRPAALDEAEAMLFVYPAETVPERVGSAVGADPAREHLRPVLRRVGDLRLRGLVVSRAQPWGAVHRREAQAFALERFARGETGWLGPYLSLDDAATDKRRAAAWAPFVTNGGCDSPYRGSRRPEPTCPWARAKNGRAR